MSADQNHRRNAGGIGNALTDARSSSPVPCQAALAADEFRPIFIVGCQRSGTTSLAVMFDRHSRIAVPPETIFFRGFVRTDRKRRAPMTHESVLARALADHRIAEAGLRHDEVIGIFRAYEPDYPSLLRAILEAHARKHGKVRPAEKTCNHLFSAPELLHHYAAAKIVCIVRDGRDVVRSLLDVEWGDRSRVAAYCEQWNRFARLGLRYEHKLPPDRFTIVRYEDLMTDAEEELRRLCEFVGEDFEPAQLRGGSNSGVVPPREIAWKGKAQDAPDVSRVAAWRNCGDPELIARLNHYMGRRLRDFGYADTAVSGQPWSRRVAWALLYIPYRRGLHPLALRANRVLRFFSRLFTSPRPP